MKRRIIGLVAALVAFFTMGIGTALQSQAATYQGTTSRTYTMQAGGTATFWATWYTSRDSLNRFVEAAYDCKVKNNSLVNGIVWKSSTVTYTGGLYPSTVTHDYYLAPGQTSVWEACSQPGAWFVGPPESLHVDFRAASSGYNYSTFRVDDPL